MKRESRNLKVVHLISGNLSGGAARGAYWLHQGLRKIGVDSWILTNAKDDFDDPHIISVGLGLKGQAIYYFRALLDRIIPFLYVQKKILFSMGCFGINFKKKQTIISDSDIIHFHWINNGFVNVADIKKLKKPIVWTCRDMWPLTGGCHISMACNKYIYGCGACPQLKSSNDKDLSHFILQRKIKYIPKDTAIVGLSSWLTNCAQKSAALKNVRSFHTIPNAVDTECFSPLNKKSSKKLLGFTDDKKVILLGSLTFNSPFKGFKEAVEALKIIAGRDDHRVVFFGRYDKKFFNLLKCEWSYLGLISSDKRLQIIYSAADVFLAPSKYEAFGKTLIESMACGTPVVAFNATGPMDIVDHMINGYLANPYDSASLAEGISWLLNHHNPNILSLNARQKVLECFEMNIIAEQYKSLYSEILFNKQSNAVARQ